MRQLSLFPKSQPFETLLIKENEVISDSSKKNRGGAKESREISLEGFMLNYKGHGSQVKAFFKNHIGRKHLASSRNSS